MAEKIGDAFVRVTADVKSFNSRMAGVQKRFGGIVRGLARGAALAGAAIGAGLVAGVVKAVRAANIQEEAVAKLNAVLKATGGAVGVSSKALQQHAADLQQITKFGDESIINTQAILATFKAIKGDAFKETTELVLDMATVLGTDAKAAALQLGKALGNPIKNASALTRSGVDLTEQQLKQIRVFQESGDILSAQKIILKELQSEFGGAAKAAGDTTAGAFAKLSNNVGDAAEQIGVMITQSTAFRDLMVSMNQQTLEFITFLEKLNQQDVFERLIMRVRLFAAESIAAFQRVKKFALGLIDVLTFGSVAVLEKLSGKERVNIEQELARKKAKINADFVRQVADKTKILAEKEANEAKAAAAVVVSAEKEKANARNRGFVSASAAIKKIQKQFFKAQKEQQAVAGPVRVTPAGRVAVTPPAVRPAVAPAAVSRAGGSAGRAMTKASTQRDKMIALLDQINSKESLPIFG